MISCFAPMKLGRDVKVDCFLIYVEVAASNMMLEDSVIGKDVESPLGKG